MGEVGTESGREVDDDDDSDVDNDEEEDFDDGKEREVWPRILFASQGSKAQNCIELVAPNIQRISRFS